MIFAVMGSERWMKMEELNGYTPPASLNLSDFQYAIGDAVVQAIIKNWYPGESGRTSESSEI